MSKLAFLADEHVNRAYVSALRSTGYCVLSVDDGYEPGKADSELLATSRSEALVIITSDDDFVELAEDVDHAGIIKYQQYGHTAKEFVRAIRRIDRYISPEEFRNHVEWLENWL